MVVVGMRAALIGPISFLSMYFSAKKVPNKRLALPSVKTWIHHCTIAFNGHLFLAWFKIVTDPFLAAQGVPTHGQFYFVLISIFVSFLNEIIKR